MCQRPFVRWCNIVPETSSRASEGMREVAATAGTARSNMVAVGQGSHPDGVRLGYEFLFKNSKPHKYSTESPRILNLPTFDPTTPR